MAWSRLAPRTLRPPSHAMWFHRPFRADDWLLYDQSSPVASGARGLAIGRLWTRDGRHVVSVVQEGLLRVVEDAKDTAR
jgi:acyl-CoA thioesterase-2